MKRAERIRETVRRPRLFSLLVLGPLALVACGLSGLDGLSGGATETPDAQTDAGPPGDGAPPHDAAVAADGGAGDAGDAGLRCGPCACVPIDARSEQTLVGNARELTGFTELTTDEMSRAGGLVYPTTSLGSKLFVSFEVSLTTSVIETAGDGLMVGWLSSAVGGTCVGAGSDLCFSNPQTAGLALVLRTVDPPFGHLNHAQLALMDAQLCGTDSPVSANEVSLDTSVVVTFVSDAGVDPPPASWHKLELSIDPARFGARAVLDQVTNVKLGQPFNLPSSGSVVIGGGTGGSTARVAVRNVTIAKVDAACQW